MTRLGRWMLLLFAVVIGIFALVVRQGRAPPAPKSESTPIASGALIVPVEGVQPAKLTDTWGDARGDGTRSHHAIDIMAARGTPVVAAASGKVEKLFESRNGGHTIYIRRADPAWVDYYAHLDSYAPDLREGVTVRAGQKVGAVGSTGDASPEAPHLHYEIKRMGAGEKWWQGTEIDPYPILAGHAAAR